MWHLSSSAREFDEAHQASSNKPAQKKTKLAPAMFVLVLSFSPPYASDCSLFSNLDDNDATNAMLSM
jgi:hypothetical protein